MKCIAKYLVVIATFLILLAGNSLAAGTITVSWDQISYDLRILKFTWVADSADGSVPNKTVTIRSEGCVFAALTNPGTVAPTDDYDIVVNGPDGVDLLGGQLMDRDTTNSERVKLTTSECVKGDITFVLTNNSVNSATGVTKLFFGR